MTSVRLFQLSFDELSVVKINRDGWTGPCLVDAKIIVFSRDSDEWMDTRKQNEDACMLVCSIEKRPTLFRSHGRHHDTANCLGRNKMPPVDRVRRRTVNARWKVEKP